MNRTKRPSYAYAVEWIALNDEPMDMIIDTISEMISVQLIADLWGKNEVQVATDVRDWRRDNPKTTAEAVRSEKIRNK